MTAFLEVAGAEAVSFLDGLTTQDVAGTPVGSAAYALFLTPKARIMAPVLLYRAGEERVLLELDPALVEELQAHLRRYRLRAKAAIEPVLMGAISVLGPRSAAAAIAAGASGEWFSSPAWGTPARTLLAPHEHTAAAVAALVAAGVACADPETADAWRIHAGVPSLSDLRPGYMPAEVGAMDVGVSLTKGCYLGQEPVARLHYRGKANRCLRGVELSAELPDAYFDTHVAGGEDYLAVAAPDGKRLGELTTWAAAPDGRFLAMAILRREVQPGAELVLSGADVTVRCP